MRTYQEVLTELKGKPLTCSRGDFYDFTGQRLEDEFKKFFELGQGFLDRDDLEYKIKPGRVYFNDRPSVNGVARLEGDLFLIEIFKVSIEKLYDHYTSRESVFHEEMFAKYKKLLDKQDISGSYVLFQFAMLYIFYHETGHLIQKSKEDPDYVEFLDGKLSDVMVKIRHIREHDADWFAINEVAFHAIQFVNTGTSENPKIDPGELATIIEMALAAIYINAIRQAEKKPALYFAEEAHPHPSVRISYMINYFLEALEANIKIPINKKEILQNAIRLSEAMLIEKDKNIVQEFSTGIFDNANEIAEYINLIRNDGETYPHLARKKIKTVVEK